MDEIKGIARVTFHPGQAEEWKRLSREAMEIVRTQDRGTLQYEIFLNEDESEAVVFERYRDADAALEHFARISHLMKPLLATATVTGEVLGTPNAKMREQLGNGVPKLFTPWIAFQEQAPPRRPEPPRMIPRESDIGQRNLTSISPFFIVKDLQASIAHYIERFGFSLDFQGPPDDVYYGHVSRDGIGIMLKAITPEVLPRPNHTRHEWARWDASIYTRDPDTLFAELQRRGAAFVKPLSFIDAGLWGFEVSDADGYVLAFFRTRDE